MSYRLSQVEDVLHALMTGPGRTAQRRLAVRPTMTFRNQIKRLLEIDRARLRSGETGSPVKPGFFDQLPGGSGTDASYDAFGTFCLAIGLELLLYGFKQREVIEKLASVRDRLRQFHEEISASLKSEGPGYERSRNEGDNDDRYIFMVIDKLDLPRAGRGQLMTHQVDDRDAAPAIQRGRKRLWDRLEHQLKRGARSMFIVELSEITARVNELLPKQTARRRGRS